MEAGKPQPQALAIAYSVKRKAKPKYAKGGQIPPSAKFESRPMPEQGDKSNAQANMASDKPAKHDNWLDNSTVKQAQRPSRIPLKHPKMVPSNAFSVRLRDQEDHLEDSAKPNNGPQHRPSQEDNEIGPDREGPKVSDMQREHNNGRKPYAKGGKINDFEPMHDAEQDNLDEPAGLESDNDMMQPEDDYMSGKMEAHNMASGGSIESGSPDMNFADGGIVHEMDDQPEDEEHLEHDASIAGAIMRRKKMAAGGILSHDSIYSDDSDQVDLSRNADEDANEEDQLSFNALRKENYNESEGLAKMSSPKNSNEHGHELSDEDAHDMVSKIRKLMSKRSPITK